MEYDYARIGRKFIALRDLRWQSGTVRDIRL